MARLSLLLATLVATAVQATYTIERIHPHTTEALETEVLPEAEYALTLSGAVSRSQTKTNMLHYLRTGKPSSHFVGGLYGADNDMEYLTDITIGGQKFKTIVDTGSSDTWLVKKGFKCFNLTSHPEPTKECAFGSAGFDPSKSHTFKPYPNKNFNISYGDGEFLTGSAGFETISVAGMTVKHQEMGLVTNAAWEGDGVNSGLMGLAYPTITSVFNGTDPDKDSKANHLPYDPVFYTALKEGVVKNPYFSVALDRGSWGKQKNSSLDTHHGHLAFGGVAPVKVTKTAATVPLQGYHVSKGNQKRLYYTVNVSSYHFEGAHAKLSGVGKQAILDTGTTLNMVPTEVAKEYNSKFSPAAKLIQGLYFVDCKAKAPAFSITIGGQNFTVDGRDNILPSGTDKKGNLLCISGTQDGGSMSNVNNTFILGDVFLHNVVATFNVKSEKVTLTQRAPY